MAADGEERIDTVHTYRSKIRELSTYNHESAVTPPKSLTTTVVERRHRYESPTEALRRREARRAVVSSPHVTPEGIVSPTTIDENILDKALESKIDSPDYRESGLRKLKTRSWESVQRWKKENEFLYAMIEDEAQWLHDLFPEEPVAAEYFFQALEDGVVLCKLAQLCQNYAEDLAKKEGITVPLFRIKIHPRHRCRGPIGQFMRRENVELFLNWCRAYKIPEPILFESNDVVEQSEEEGLREGAREIVLCLMEVARLGVKFGVRPPQLILLEHEIDQEEKLDSMLGDRSSSPLSVDSGVDTEHDLHFGEMKDFVDAASPSDNKSDDGISGEDESRRASRDDSDNKSSKGLTTPSKSSHPDKNQRRKSSQQIKSELHDRVTKLIEEYNIQKFTRLREGKYIILGKVMFVRMLNGHVIVRVGGGWDGLEHYIMTHAGGSVERSKSPVNVQRNRSSSNHSTPSSGLAASKLRNPAFAASSPAIHLLSDSTSSRATSGESSSNSSRSSSPAPNIRDSYTKAEWRRKEDERKISHAIQKVQANVAETYSRLLKASSLADLTDGSSRNESDLPTFRKFSAFEPLTSNRSQALQKMADAACIPSSTEDLSATSQHGAGQREFLQSSIVFSTNVYDPEFGASEKTVTVEKSSKTSSTARTKTTTKTTVTTTRVTSGKTAKAPLFKVTETRSSALRAAKLHGGAASNAKSTAGTTKPVSAKSSESKPKPTSGKTTSSSKLTSAKPASATSASSASKSKATDSSGVSAKPTTDTSKSAKVAGKAAKSVTAPKSDTKNSSSAAKPAMSSTKTTSVTHSKAAGKTVTSGTASKSATLKSTTKSSTAETKQRAQTLPPKSKPASAGASTKTSGGKSIAEKDKTKPPSTVKSSSTVPKKSTAASTSNSSATSNRVQATKTTKKATVAESKSPTKTKTGDPSAKKSATVSKEKNAAKAKSKDTKEHVTSPSTDSIILDPEEVVSPLLEEGTLDEGERSTADSQDIITIKAVLPKVNDIDSEPINPFDDTSAAKDSKSNAADLLSETVDETAAQHESNSMDSDNAVLSFDSSADLMQVESTGEAVSDLTETCTAVTSVSSECSAIEKTELPMNASNANETEQESEQNSLSQNMADSDGKVDYVETDTVESVDAEGYQHSDYQTEDTSTSHVSETSILHGVHDQDHHLDNNMPTTDMEIEKFSSEDRSAVAREFDEFDETSFQATEDEHISTSTAEKDAEVDGDDHKNVSQDSADVAASSTSQAYDHVQESLHEAQPSGETSKTPHVGVTFGELPESIHGDHKKKDDADGDDLYRVTPLDDYRYDSDNRTPSDVLSPTMSPTKTVRCASDFEPATDSLDTPYESTTPLSDVGVGATAIVHSANFTNRDDVQDDECGNEEEDGRTARLGFADSSRVMSHTEVNVECTTMNEPISKTSQADIVSTTTDETKEEVEQNSELFGTDNTQSSSFPESTEDETTSSLVASSSKYVSEIIEAAREQTFECSAPTSDIDIVTNSIQNTIAPADQSTGKANVDDDCYGNEIRDQPDSVPESSAGKPATAEDEPSEVTAMEGSLLQYEQSDIADRNADVTHTTTVDDSLQSSQVGELSSASCLDLQNDRDDDGIEVDDPSTPSCFDPKSGPSKIASGEMDPLEDGKTVDSQTIETSNSNTPSDPGFEEDFVDDTQPELSESCDQISDSKCLHTVEVHAESTEVNHQGGVIDNEEVVPAEPQALISYEQEDLKKDCSSRTEISATHNFDTLVDDPTVSASTAGSGTFSEGTVTSTDEIHYNNADEVKVSSDILLTDSCTHSNLETAAIVNMPLEESTNTEIFDASIDNIHETNLHHDNVSTVVTESTEITVRSNCQELCTDREVTEKSESEEQNSFIEGAQVHEESTSLPPGTQSNADVLATPMNQPESLLDQSNDENKGVSAVDSELETSSPVHDEHTKLNEVHEHALTTSVTSVTESSFHTIDGIQMEDNASAEDPGFTIPDLMSNEEVHSGSLGPSPTGGTQTFSTTTVTKEYVIQSDDGDMQSIRSVETFESDGKSDSLGEVIDVHENHPEPDQKQDDLLIQDNLPLQSHAGDGRFTMGDFGGPTIVADVSSDSDVDEEDDSDGDVVGHDSEEYVLDHNTYQHKTHHQSVVTTTTVKSVVMTSEISQSESITTSSTDPFDQVNIGGTGIPLDSPFRQVEEHELRNGHSDEDEE